MKCETHSSDGVVTYCFNDPADMDNSGGHQSCDHKNMTLWAKHMVSYKKHSIKRDKTYHYTVVTQKSQ
jgi:hypothetical protein